MVRSGAAGGVGLEADLPVADVGAEKREVDAAVARLLRRARASPTTSTRRGRPRGTRGGARARRADDRPLVGVDVGDVADVVALALEKAHARCTPSGAGNRRRRRGERRRDSSAYGRSNDTLRAGALPLLNAYSDLPPQLLYAANVVTLD